jgi:hypothetical protein
MVIGVASASLKRNLDDQKSVSRREAVRGVVSVQALMPARRRPVLTGRGEDDDESV